MLDPWIIEEIRRRERREEEERHRPEVVEMPVHGPRPQETDEERGKSEEGPRGVTIIDFGV